MGVRLRSIRVAAAFALLGALLAPAGAGAQQLDPSVGGGASDPSDATLASLSLTGAELGFDPAETQYWVAYGAPTAHPTIEAAAAQPGAQIAFSPADADPDTAGYQVATSGLQVVRVNVTSPDGTARRSYVLWLFDYRLRSLGLEGHDIGFDRLVADYAVTVPNDVDTVTVTADDGAHTLVYGSPDADPDTDGHQASLEVGVNEITVTATPKPTRVIATPQTYTITVDRLPQVAQQNQADPQDQAPSDDASLSSLTLSGTSLSFAAATTSYDVDFVAAADHTTITAAAAHSAASVDISPADADATAPGHQVAITAGAATAVTVTVTAKDTTTTQTYRLNVSDARLRGLVVSDVHLDFDPATASYALEVFPETSVVTLVPDSASLSKLDVDFSPADSDANTNGHQVALSEGANTITATASLKGGSDSQDYTITITRGTADADARLASVEISPGFLAFKDYQRSHTAYISPDTAQVTVSAEAVQTDADVDISPADADPDTDGHQVGTTAATTDIAVTVTSADGNVTHSHTVAVKHRSGGFVEVDVGWGTACSMHLTGRVRCWGRHTEVWHMIDFGFEGRLAASPPHDSRYTDIGVGLRAACGVRPDSTLHCWDTEGGDFDATTVASLPADGVSAFDHSGLRACWLDTDHRARCTFSLTPETSQKRYQAIVAGRRTACALGLDGRIDCWKDAQAGGGAVEGPTGQFKRLAGGPSDRMCAIALDNTVTCWRLYLGSDGSFYGAYGYRTETAPSGTYLDVSIGRHLSCGVTTDNVANCWRGSVTFPTGIEFESISANVQLFVCGLTTDGEIKCYEAGANEAFDMESAMDVPDGSSSTLAGMSLTRINLRFAPARTSYSVIAPYDGDSTTLKLSGSNSAGAQISPDDADPDTAGHQVDYSSGSATVTVTVTSLDGNATTTYTVAITRAEVPDDEARLKSLGISDVALAFDDDTYLYRAEVAADVESVTVNPTAYHDDAAVVVLPADADSNTDGHQVSLTAGAKRVVTVTVISEDDSEAATYTVIITRPTS